MFVRDPALPAPPDRPPYLTVIVREARYTLRAPSLPKAGKWLGAVPEEHRAVFLSLASYASEPAGLLSLVSYQPAQLSLLAAVVGLCWADPVHGLTTPAWAEGQSLVDYGAAIYDELDEHGWGFRDIVSAAMAVAAVTVNENKLDEAVTERAAFFRLPRASSSESESLSSVGPSAVTAESGSTN